MEFKDRIKSLRAEEGLSALELAKKLGKSESAIRMWESGKAKPDADTLVELSRLFNCTTDYMLGLDDYKNKIQGNSFAETEKALVDAINRSRCSINDRIEIYSLLTKILSYHNDEKLEYSNDKHLDYFFDWVVQIFRYMETFSVLFSSVASLTENWPEDKAEADAKLKNLQMSEMIRLRSEKKAMNIVVTFGMSIENMNKSLYAIKAGQELTDEIDPDLESVATRLGFGDKK